MGKRVKITECQFKNVMRMALHESIYNDLQLVQSAPELVEILNSNTIFGLIAKNTEIQYKSNTLIYGFENYANFTTYLNDYEVDGTVEFTFGIRGDEGISKINCDFDRIFNIETEEIIPITDNDKEVLKTIFLKTLKGVIEDDMGVKFDLEVFQDDDYRE